MSGLLPISNELPVKIPAPNAKSPARLEKSLFPEQKSLAPKQKSFFPEQKSLSPFKKSPLPEQKSLFPKQKSLAPKQKSLARLEKSLAPKQKSRHFRAVFGHYLQYLIEVSEKSLKATNTIASGATRRTNDKTRFDAESVEQNRRMFVPFRDGTTHYNLHRDSPDAILFVAFSDTEP